MKSSANSVEEYIQGLSEERKIAVSRIREAVLSALPKGFTEQVSYGSIGYVVPLSLYPKGYHCNPKLPLPFMNIASQKNYISFHHMGLYGDPQLLAWFQAEYPKYAKTKLDMGKGCVRFKKIDDLPIELIKKLCAKIKPQDWIKMIEKSMQR